MNAAGPHSAADAWTGRVVGGRWKILSLLDDSGGMASVYLAEDSRLGRKAVVKIPKAAHQNAEFAERFKRESFYHAKVENLHVVHILDRGEEAGTPFLVLQYLPGGNLKAWCARNPSILDDPRLHYESWLLPIAQALDAVAAQGIVHRDVKPTNILFDAAGKGYLSDFGIVKAGGEATMTGTGMFIGTLQFMSPEQCQPESKRSLDGRSDQFGLAVTVYQVLTGWKYPVDDDTAVVYAAKFGHVAMKPPREHVPRVPAAVNDAVLRALAPDRDARFPSSVEFARAVMAGFGPAGGWRGTQRPGTVAVPVVAARGAEPPPLPALTRTLAEAAPRLPQPQVAVTELERVVVPPDRTGSRTGAVVAALGILGAVVLSMVGLGVWLQWRPDVPPVAVVPPPARADDATLDDDVAIPSETTTLIDQVFHLLEEGKNAEAEPLAKRAVDVATRDKGPDDPDTAVALHNLGVTYVRLGRYDDAESVHGQALEIRERVLEPDSPDTVTSRNALAEVYSKQGRYDEAVPLYKRVLAIRERTLGAKHRDTAMACYNLALTYENLGKYADAEPLYERALGIRERVLGKNDPDTLASVGGLAVTYHNQGRYDEAEPLYERVVAGLQSVVGPDHTDVAQYLSNLALLYDTLGRYDDAEPLFERALAIREKMLGADHPTTRSTRENLAELLSKRARAAPPAGTLVINSIGMKLVVIPAGDFQMGSNDTKEGLKADGFTFGDFESYDCSDESPVHPVRITKPFLMGRHEVTLGQFLKFYHDGYEGRLDCEADGKGGAGYTGAPDDQFMQRADFVPWSWGHPDQTNDHPVVNVSWNDCVAFCEWLSRKEGKTYRLPTEAEWEYACRAGTQKRFWNGDDADGVTTVGNVADATAKERFAWWTAAPRRDGYAFTAPVESFLANPFGLYDVHGNVFEWCSDCYDEAYYATSPVADPRGPDSPGLFRVVRGGSWRHTPVYARSARRNSDVPTYRSDILGFRVVCELE